MPKNRFLLLILFLCIGLTSTNAQELKARVTINRSKVSDTKSEVFEALERKMTEFLNDHAWTEIKFRENEKIQCNFLVTVNTYSATDNSFSCNLLVTASRPVFNSNYMTTSYAVNDGQFNFLFHEADQLEYNPTNIDNNLVALLAYYAYMIIGMDFDTMSPLGGTDVLHTAEDIVSVGQNLGFPGWKAFDDSKNRFALLNDYMDGSMESMRQMRYVYHRKGLDQMSEKPDEARAAIMEALEMLDEAHHAKNMSQVAQLFTEYKRDELVNIFSKKGTKEEKERAYDILFGIDASQNETWQKIKK